MYVVLSALSSDELAGWQRLMQYVKDIDVIVTSNMYSLLYTGISYLGK